MAVTTINIDSQVLTFANLAAFPLVGTVKTIYIAEDTDISYYWDGAAYQDIKIDTSGLVPAGLITTSGLTMNTGVLLGRGTAGVGAVEEIVIGSGLTLTGTTLSAAGGGITIGTTAITGGTVGRILFEGAGNVVQQSSNFFWDNTNSRLGIRVATPTASLEVLGAAASGTTQSFAVHNSTGNNNSFIVLDNGFLGLGALPFASTTPVRIKPSGGGIDTNLGIRSLVSGVELVSLENAGTLVRPLRLYGSSVNLSPNATDDLMSLTGSIASAYNVRIKGSTSGEQNVISLNNFTDALSGTLNIQFTRATGNIEGGKIGCFLPVTAGVPSEFRFSLRSAPAGSVNELMRLVGNGNLLIGTTTDNPRALLNLTSNSKGLLVPRLTTTERNAVSWVAGDAGMIIYNTTDNQFQGWNGTTWNNL